MSKTCRAHTWSIVGFLALFVSVSWADLPPAPVQTDDVIRIHPIEKTTQVAPSAVQPLLAEALTFINVPAARQEFTVSGRGLTAVVIDTGIRASHFDFCGRIAAQRNFTGTGQVDAAADGQGHGTNVAGIIAASREKCPSGAVGRNEGVAPGARLIALKVLKDDGTGDMKSVDAALDWVIARVKEAHAGERVSVVNMSLGLPRNHASDDQLLTGATALKIKALRDLGIPVVVAAGNDYGAFGKPGMSFPAIIRWTTSVGAVFDANIGARNYGTSGAAKKTRAGQITPFSQRVPADAGLFATDIFAPGASILSTGIKNDAGHSEQEGTSQAAPMVSGTVLLLQEMYLRETKSTTLPSVDQVESWLRSRAVMEQDAYGDDDTVANTNKAYPRLDARQALRALRDALKSNGQKRP